MRILLAEDERELSDALKAILIHNNYSVDAVYDGSDAIDWFESGNYDIVILDIMMPRINGLDVLRHIRASGSKVPIMLLTARSEIDDRVIGLDAGADDYLTKPFATRELLARLRAMSRRQTDTVSSVLSFGNVTLDRSSYILSGPQGSFRLANKEYQMAEMLMSSPSRIIPTEQFMDRIWGFDSEAEINVVWVYISYLRKKLAAIGAEIAIKANRNSGYSLELTNN